MLLERKYTASRFTRDVIAGSPSGLRYPAGDGAGTGSGVAPQHGLYTRCRRDRNIALTGGSRF